MSERYVLRELVTGKFFVRMTGIGPMLGTKEKAARFESEDAARSCSAMWHPLTIFRPESLAAGHNDE